MSDVAKEPIHLDIQSKPVEDLTSKVASPGNQLTSGLMSMFGMLKSVPSTSTSSDTSGVASNTITPSGSSSAGSDSCQVGVATGIDAESASLATYQNGLVESITVKENGVEHEVAKASVKGMYSKQGSVKRKSAPPPKKIDDESRLHDLMTQQSEGTFLQTLGITPEQKQELEDAFRRIDVNGDGRISPTELSDMLRSLDESISDDEIQQMILEADQDGDGFIDFREFIAVHASMTVMGGGGFSHEEMEAVFETFDKDGDGFISADELFSVLTSLGDEDVTLAECSMMIKGVDSDGDGRVDFDEFEEMMTRRMSMDGAPTPR